MPNCNMAPNSTTSEEYVEVEIEATDGTDAENGRPGLSFTLRHDDNEVEFWEQAADAIKEFRDLVVQECDKALALIG